MRAAEKEIEFMEKEAVEDAEKEGRTLPPGEIRLPMFKELQAKKRSKAEEKMLEERAILEKNVTDLEKQIKQIQKAIRDLDGVQSIDSFFRQSSDLTEKMTAELANVIAKVRSPSMTSIAKDFISKFQSKVGEKAICDKIEILGVKEKRIDEGDTVPIWYVSNGFTHMLTSETKSHLEEDREERIRNLNDKEKRRKSSNGCNSEDEKEPGAIGPDGDFVEFPDYDGEETPRENKKAFTLFCNKTRKEVKSSLAPSDRKNKVNLFICTCFTTGFTHTFQLNFFQSGLFVWFDRIM